ncbi:hypothetical protein [Reinekea sp.]|jgi:hypothetical protein|uniref:DUF3024 domain-containing protein n=1 Tax=Reinekea sp. TaxID=1970455 RepID=UPI003989A499
MSKIEDLPPLVKKQAEHSIAKLLQYPPKGKRLFVSFKGRRVLIQEEVPHPTKSINVRLPFALLDFTDSGWLLLFRGSEGGWQSVPEDKPNANLDDKIALIRVDPHGVFWR